jgi:hypothetical protein
VIGVGRGRVNNMSTDEVQMTSKLEINVSFPKKLTTMKIYLKLKQMLCYSMQNEIVDCLKSVFPQE